MLLLAIVPIRILNRLADCTEGHARCCTIVQARRAFGNTAFSLCVCAFDGITPAQYKRILRLLHYSVANTSDSMCGTHMLAYVVVFPSMSTGT